MIKNKKMTKTIRYAAAIALAVTMSSCNLYKKYEMPVENPYVNEFAKSVTAEADSASLPFLGWQQVFTDPTLQGYIRTALENNKDLDDARRNIEIARAQLKGAKLSYFPAVSFNPNGGASKYGSDDLSKWSYTLPIAINWEIDVFGKILNSKRNAQVGVEQTEDYRQAVQSQIVCGVASTYYGLMLLDRQLKLTKSTAEIWADQVESMKLMKQAGMVNEAAVVQSEANYFSICASIPDIEQNIHKLNNTMSLLLHSYPQSWPVSNDMSFSLPAEIANGVPLTYLGARPDVRAAERGLASAYYTVNSARAAFYPGLNISTNGGFTNLLGSMISNPGKWFIQLAGSLAAPIFSRGKNIANLEVAKARQAIAMNAFEKTVLNAAADVSDALSAYSHAMTKMESLEKQTEALKKSVDYTQELLTLDRNTTYLEVLTARSSLLNSQMAELQCWHTKVNSLISLYQSVGGGR